MVQANINIYYIEGFEDSTMLYNYKAKVNI